MMTLKSYRASDYFEIKKNTQKSYLNLSFKSKNNLKVPGPGVYCIEFKGQIVYVGKFQGSKDSLSGGDIFSDRWCRHLQTLTGRGERLSISKNVFNKLKVSYPFIEKILNDQRIDTLTKDKGNHSSFNRARFALGNVFHLSDSEILDEFCFYYFHFDSIALGGLEEGRSFISSLENHLLGQVTPVCNKEYRSDVRDISINDVKEIIINFGSLSEAA